MKSGKPLLLGLWISTLWWLAGCVSVPLPNQNPTSVASLPINLSVEPEESPKPLVTEALITESLLSKEMPLETHGDLPGTTPAFAGLMSLQATDVVSEALKRNQSLVAISKALEAAQSKYSQAISLEDPSIGGWFAPGTIGSNQVDFAIRLELSQKVPSRGKRQLRGEMANAQAKASENDLGSLRLQLVENASNAFYDLYLVQRAMEVSEDTRKILVEFRQNAETFWRNSTKIFRVSSLTS
ncbi:MAG: TolC family protein, partial [Gemmataceae bacterium]